MRAWLLAGLLVAYSGCVFPMEGRFTIGTTTSLEDSGILDVLLDAFEQQSGIETRALVSGTGDVIQKARRGDVHVLLTHSPQRERQLVAEGVALTRHAVMFNTFVIAGPAAADPARVQDASDAPDALRRIHDARALFASRGDESGTHDKELGLWAAAGLDPASFDAAWYKETGTGQGATLLYAAETGAYVLIDEATLLQFRAHGRAMNVQALFTNDVALRNQYSVLELNESKVPGALPTAHARRFAEWLTGPVGQGVIEGFRASDFPVFVPNAGDPAYA